MKLTLKELVVFALLGSLTFCAKMVMAGLPNIEPVSIFLIVFTAVFGLKAMYIVVVYVMLEFLVWGMGLWWMMYVYIWPLFCLLCYLFRRMDSSLGWAILSGIFGLAFGLLCTPVYSVTGGLAYALTSWVSGIPFDLAHCAGNFALALVLYKPLTGGLKKLTARFM